jgi:hypothetical protein
MLLELEHEFEHSRRLNNVPYVPGDLPVLSDESILKKWCLHDAVRVDVWQFTYGHSLRTRMDMTQSHTR